jgi:hypothetical protein
LPAKTQHAFLVLPQHSQPSRFHNPNNNIQNSLLAERCNRNCHFFSIEKSS